ncbi:MAG TPA: protein kinase [Pyrinomonadaceae bacterium]|nr:protein kinase [Pyrinomonadaceae bacterium]
MSLSPNTTLAHYTIVSKIGAGGMGEVYRARDNRLDREVAIKLLPIEVSSDSDRLQRFEQEARATSALNHPNILTVYDIGTHEGSPYIVAELLEGEELRDRLDVGQIPLRKAIDYAQQIVSGLSAAHEKGIVHRDLKPENVFITKDDRVKILDFGLAKLRGNSGEAQGSEDATRKAITNPGVVMGTVGYMSPEQVRSQLTDQRSDIFAFGVILFEMLTGKRAFHRESVVETMHAILKDDVSDLDGDASRVTPALEKLMRRCLEKKPEHRFHSAHDLGFALEALASPTGSSGGLATVASAASAVVVETPRSTWSSRPPWILAGAFALVAAAVILFTYFKNPSSAGATAVRLSFNPPPNLSFNDGLLDAAVISPDGQKIVFSASSSDGKSMLYVRTLDSSDATLLPGSDNAVEPFWSPDSRSVAFGSNGKLKRSDLAGGNAQVLCDSARLTGGTWSNSGVIVFEPDYRLLLMQVSSQGGEPQILAMNSVPRPDERQINPIFLSDGRKFLFRRQTGTVQAGIWVGSLDSPEISQVVGEVGPTPFVFARQGWLLYIRNDTLVAQALDSSNKLSGEAIPIISGQRNAMGNVRRFSVSDNGILIWQGQWQRDYQLVWFDREGKQVGAVDTPTKVSVGQDPQISPDGKRVLVKKAPSDGGNNNIWVEDLEKGTTLRITSTFAQMPVWSPDGNRIAYNCDVGICLKNANGLGDAEQIYAGTNFTSQWSPDGRYIIFLRRGVKTRLDMYALSMTGERRETLLLNSAADEQNPQLSPDGKWLAYSSDETGTYEIYVQSFTDGKLGSDRKRISTAGGKFPVWRRDGTELFFVAQDGQLMASNVKTSGSEFEFNTPKALFKTRMLSWTLNVHEVDVSPDGQRFLIGTMIGDTKAPAPTVLLNWTALVRK